MAMENGKNLQTQPNAINLKDITNLTRKTDKELLHGKVGISSLEITSTMKGVGMVKCTGQMVRLTKETGKRESNTEKE